MTMAIANALLRTRAEAGGDVARAPAALLRNNAQTQMRVFAQEISGIGYGPGFLAWLESDRPRPYNSYGNGSAMRVSACGWAADSEEDAAEMARIVSEPTHNHPEGRGAVATASAIYRAREGADKDELRRVLSGMYDLNFTLDEIRDTYRFDPTCPGSVPQAIVAFLEADSYEETIRNAVSIGGDSDTIAAIAGSIAEAYFGIPPHLQDRILTYITQETLLLDTLRAFNTAFAA